MPKISEMTESKFLKQSDIDEDGTVLTVKRLGRENVARDDEPEEQKWILYFKEVAKGMVLNVTNIQLMALACASEDTDDWVGQSVTIYVDHSVSFGGKLVGGLRVRPKPKTKPAPAKKAVDDGMDDDIPWTQDKPSDFHAALSEATNWEQFGKIWNGIPKGQRKEYAEIRKTKQTEFGPNEGAI